jgi:L-gulono-1,4-lactone dehydrogenase
MGEILSDFNELKPKTSEQILNMDSIHKLLKEKGIESKQRHTWSNTTKTQKVQPLEYVKPRSLNDLVDIVKIAELYNYKVRCLGSSLSFSDVAITNDILLSTHGINKTLPLERELIKETVDRETLYRVECGIRICDLNKILEKEGLALPNMGGYTAQTIVGVTSTSTHGTGITLPPLSDLIEAMEVVGENGQVYRIESSEGISDPEKYQKEHPEIKLIQNDDWFNSVRVSMGSTGLVYSVVLRVMKSYFLSETRSYAKWEDAKDLMREGTVFKENRHFEVIVNPYKVFGNYYCIIYTMNIVENPKRTHVIRGWRRILPEIMASIPFAHAILIFFLNLLPKMTPTFLNSALKALIDTNYINKSYKVLDLGAANKISAYSAEIGFPMNNETYIKAADKIIEMAELNRKNGNVFQTSPFAMRFVKASECYLSMTYGYDTCMIEMPLVNGTQGGLEILERYENAMYEFSGRPHWGQVNHVSGNHGFIKKMYPMYEKWQKIFNEFNQKGTFVNKFTDRCGFSLQGPFEKPEEKGNT